MLCDFTFKEDIRDGLSLNWGDQTWLKNILDSFCPVNTLLPIARVISKYAEYNRISTIITFPILPTQQYGWFKILVELLIKMHCLLTLFSALFPTALPLIPHAWNRCIHTRGKYKRYVYVVLFPVTIEISWWSPNKAMSNSKLTLMGFTTTVPRSCLFVSYELTLGDIA